MEIPDREVPGPCGNLRKHDRDPCDYRSQYRKRTAPALMNRSRCFLTDLSQANSNLRNSEVFDVGDSFSDEMK